MGVHVTGGRGVRVCGACGGSAPSDDVCVIHGHLWRKAPHVLRRCGRLHADRQRRWPPVSPLHACANSGLISFIGSLCEVTVTCLLQMTIAACMLSAAHRQHTSTKRHLRQAGVAGPAAGDLPHACAFTRRLWQGMSVMGSAMIHARAIQQVS